MRAKDIMETRLVSVPPDMTLPEFEEFLTVQGIDGAPVKAANGEIIGIASKTDVIQALRYQDPEKVGDAERQTVTVGDIMTYDVVCVAPDTPVREIAEIMIDQGIHRVLVGNERHVQGIITAFDLLKFVR